MIIQWIQPEKFSLFRITPGVIFRYFRYNRFMNEFLHHPGFLGTSANRAADMTLVLMLAIAGLFSFGFYLARRRKHTAHRWVQTSAVILNLLMVLWMMILPFRDFVV